ncbi:myrosinase 1-like [Cylas formicarius]|uniref:myrosinase 1-like n=1 Tax=Cylas formicarius TaxID=197179 RepID=UPI002958454B|nr:myrosinase 1-like [Cylas formicarius]
MKGGYLLAVISIVLQFRVGFGLSNYKFPDHFKFGAATAAYPIEGAWNIDGKGPSFWDNITHAFPNVVADGTNGDVACDSYHRYTEDIPLFANIGIDFYKFSISWPRILPKGTFYDFISISTSSIYRYHRFFPGKVGMAFSLNWYLPATNSRADKKAAERARAFVFEWFAHPIIKGNYPRVLIDQVGKLSRQEGESVSRLPQFTRSEISNIKGTYDFVGINAFKTFFVSDLSHLNLSPSFRNDVRVKEFTNSSLDTSSADISSPTTFRDSIVYASDYCNGCETILTEHGFNARTETLNDRARINFMKTYMDEVLIAIYEDKVNVTAYTVWSAMDFVNFQFGLTSKLGLIHVDFSSCNLTRTPKLSSKYYKSIIRTRSLKKFWF